jgi:hypothetical protein
MPCPKDERMQKITLRKNQERRIKINFDKNTESKVQLDEITLKSLYESSLNASYTKAFQKVKKDICNTFDHVIYL